MCSSIGIDGCCASTAAVYIAAAAAAAAAAAGRGSLADEAKNFLVMFPKRRAMADGDERDV